MSSTLAMNEGATRTPRLTPPAAPTRKPTPRRRTLGQGASAVGLAERPVLRIVARRPVVEPGPPSMVEPGPPSVVEPASAASGVETRLPSVVEPASAASGVETLRPVDLQDFFASEWDGDDVSVEIARPQASSIRLTRRGRLVVFGASLAAVLGLGFLAASGSLANDKPEPTRVVTVQPGQTLWDISSQVSGGGDVRSTMAHLEAINHLDSTTLQVGQHLRVPR
jgi:nucleoid-associated protein YgaU